MMSTNRLEAFSDGVFAIAITLLILEIDVPKEDDLWNQLRHIWPSYAAYATSFFTIGIIWVNHHFQFERTTKVTRPLLYINLFLLMVVAFIPFPTAVIAEHVRNAANNDVSAAFYAATLLAMSICFLGLAEYTRKAGLLKDDLPEPLLRALAKRGSVGVIAYLSAIGVAFWNPKVSLGICAATAIFYIFPGREVSRLRADYDESLAQQSGPD